MVLTSRRRELILETVRSTGGIRIAALVDRLGVSSVTVHRDLDVLVRQGVVRKVHGGAVAVESAGRGRARPAPEPDRAGTEAALADAAVRLVAPGAVVALAAGPTALAVAARLPEIPDLTVVTNSLPVADLLAEAGRHAGTAGPSVVLSGGTPTRSGALVGTLADQAIRSLPTDLLFLGVHGVSERAGLTTPDLAEAQTNRALIASAGRTVVLAGHTRWGVVGLSSFAALAEVECFITDDALPAAARDVLARKTGELLLVPAVRLPGHQKSWHHSERSQL
ncbi:cytochrome C [Kitasatospora sp. MMS16-BH015]|nr:cytochrome C [Kitasatospora sp. MMS16-BH015]